MTTLEHLQDMFSNTVVSDGERYMTIDVAGKGSTDPDGNESDNDYTVFTIWDGLEVEQIIKKHRQSTDITIRDAKDYASLHKVPYSHIAVDANGLGVSVADGLNGCVAFNSNSSPFLTKSQIRDKKSRIENDYTPAHQAIYANLKTQCAFKLAELVNDHKISASSVGDYRDEIIADLTANLQERDIEKDGKKKMATKEDIKAELGRSPDVGDTFLMRMYWVLKADTKDEDPVKSSHVQQQQTNVMRQRMNHIERNSTR
jgi:hypothetical protein